MFPIVPRRKIWFAFSGFLVAAAAASIALFGLNLGIDFTGGTRVQIHFETQKPEKSAVKKVFESAVGAEKGEKITEVLDANDFLIRSRKLDEKEISSLTDTLSKNFPDAKIVAVNTIGASVGAVFKKRAAWAIALAIVGIILFVAFAFRTVPDGYSSWSFGLATIVALAHDIFITVGFFAAINHFLGNEVDSLFITALLTILGYSVNDTIIVFDRVRENLLREKRKTFEQIAEKSVWDSMRRSINTSFSTLLVVGTMIFYFASFDSLFSFFLALSIGILVGTYSSIFLATPLLVAWHRQK